MEFEITADQFAKGMAAGERLRQRTPLAVSAKRQREQPGQMAPCPPAAFRSGLSSAS
jgi:hypothetical protein